MRVGLMPHVPDHTVEGGIEHIMKCKGELDHTQVGSQMATILRHGTDDRISDFLSQVLELGKGKLFQLPRAVDL